MVVRCDYLQNPNLYMEHGGQDDEYDYLQNRYLHFEHAGQDNNFVVDKTNLSLSNLMKIIVKRHDQQKPMI
jgi:hypothetical protein